MKRSGPLKRSPMKRTPMRPGKRKTKYARRERDVPYMMWVKSLPCLLRGFSPCSGVVEADHAGDRAFGQKADDRTCIPLCTRHHRERHDSMGLFRGRTKEWKREWRHAAIRGIQLKHEGE